MRILRPSLALPFSAALVLALALPSAASNIQANNAYSVHNLVSDQPGVATFTDANLRNGWGIAASGGSPWWVADNHTDKSTLYRGDGSIQTRVVGVAGGPTGVIFNGTADFTVTDGTTTAPALFIFATEGGQILGWNPTVGGGTDAVLGGAHTGAIYKGLAIGVAGDARNYLYAADFHNANSPNGAIDVYDASYALATLPGDFTDPGIPAGFAPFNVQNIAGTLYVTYAMQDADAEDEIAGPGLGYVSAFDTDGNFLGRVASGGDLNAPWGLAWAPAAGFGKFSGNLLVGNFGDGAINAFAATSSGWEARGHLKTPDHHRLTIDGLWGIGFGNGSGSGPTTTLYFAAGPNDEENGLFGSITSAP
jgi:uncharacterized protein (TIGR03118 family)